jgi:hypothetical protein
MTQPFLLLVPEVANLLVRKGETMSVRVLQEKPMRSPVQGG